MRKRLLMGVILLLSAQGAAAEEAVCREGRADVLTLSRWEANRRDAQDRKGAVLKFEITNPTERHIVMVEGKYIFRDVLGRHVWSSDLPPDLRLGPGETASESKSFSCCFDRFPDIDPALLRHAICVTAVVHEGGAVERFE